MPSSTWTQKKATIVTVVAIVVAPTLAAFVAWGLGLLG